MANNTKDIDALIEAVLSAPAGATWTELVRVAKLDPAKDFRKARLVNVDFSKADLRGFDFTGAKMTGCRFDGALLRGAIFDEAELDDGALSRAADASMDRALDQPHPFMITNSDKYFRSAQQRHRDSYSPFTSAENSFFVLASGTHSYAPPQSDSEVLPFGWCALVFDSSSWAEFYGLFGDRRANYRRKTQSKRLTLNHLEPMLRDLSRRRVLLLYAVGLVNRRLMEPNRLDGVSMSINNRLSDASSLNFEMLLNDHCEQSRALPMILVAGNDRWDATSTRPVSPRARPILRSVRWPSANLSYPSAYSDLIDLIKHRVMSRMLDEVVRSGERLLFRRSTATMDIIDGIRLRTHGALTTDTDYIINPI